MVGDLSVDGVRGPSLYINLSYNSILLQLWQACIALVQKHKVLLPGARQALSRAAVVGRIVTGTSFSPAGRQAGRQSGRKMAAGAEAESTHVDLS